MDCCSSAVIESRFDEQYVQKKLKRYRKKGPKETTTILARVIAEEMTQAATLLDIGGGIGDLQHMLIPMGVARTINCEASTAFLQACNQEAASQGYADQITHIQGDFVELANEIPEADIVTLDRVICCYPDMPELVSASLRKALTLYGIVIPSETWWVKLATSVYYNLRFLMQKNPFRVFVHSTDAMEDLIHKAGFQRLYYQETGGWQILVFSRQSS
jgi:2-polyprenyl-3-methyl-5-hydroxy-6-metoxy-1,4-benzoquinol methylase